MIDDLTPPHWGAEPITTAPERIWLQDGGDFDAASEVTWCQHSIDDADTEYVRADLAAVQPAKVRVKPLVWDEPRDANNWINVARSVFGDYYISIDGGRHSAWLEANVKPYENKIGDEVGSVIEAMMLAETDYQARMQPLITPQPDPRDEVIKGLGPIADLLPDAVAAAEKAMRKYPQPNYVISKWAEETGEVTKDLIHMAEGRQTVEKLRGEIVQSLAMLHRLLVEGDQVHGLPPIAAALAAAKAVQK